MPRQYIKILFTCFLFVQLHHQALADCTANSTLVDFATRIECDETDSSITIPFLHAGPGVPPIVAHTIDNTVLEVKSGATISSDNSGDAISIIDGGFFGGGVVNNNLIDNKGTIQATGTRQGIDIDAGTGHSILNTGTISAVSSQAIRFDSSGQSIDNRGTISSTLAQAFQSDTGSHTFINSGTVRGATIGIHNDGGAMTITNSGTIEATNAGGSAIDGSDSTDTVLITAGTITGRIRLDGGNDSLTISGGTINGDIDLGSGVDTFILSTTVNGDVDLGDSTDIITLNSGSRINGNLNLGAGNEVVANEGTINGTVNLGTGTDNFTNNNTIDADAGVAIQGSDDAETVTNTDTITGAINLAGGTDNLILRDGSSVTGDIDLGTGTDLMTIESGATINGNLSLGDGNEDIDNNGTINGTVDLGTGTNSFTNIGTINAGTDTAINGNSGVDTVTNDGTITGDITLAGGADVFVLNSGSTLTGDVDLGDDTDNVTINNGATLTGNLSLGAGDEVVINDGTINGTVDLGTGTDQLTNNATINAGAGATAINGSDDGETVTNNDQITGNINLAGGADTLVLNNGSTVEGNIDLGDGTDNVTIVAGATIEGNLSLGAGDEVVDNEGTIEGTVDLGAGADNFTNSGSIDAGVGTAILGSADAETVTNKGDITGNIDLAGGVDTLVLETGSTVDGNISLGDETDLVTIASGATLTGDLDLGAGDEVVDNLGTINGTVILGTGADEFTNNGTITAGTGGVAVTGSDDDETLVNNMTISGNVNLAGGADSLTLNDGSNITGDVDLGDGGDTLTLNNGAGLDGSVALGAGDDTFNINGDNAVLTLATLDGGAGTGDALNFNGNGALSSSNISNMETVSVNADLNDNTWSWNDVTMTGGTLNVESGTLEVTGGTIDSDINVDSTLTIDAGDMFTLRTGNTLHVRDAGTVNASDLTIADGAALVGAGTINGSTGSANAELTVSGDISPGTDADADGQSTIDTLTINGNLTTTSSAEIITNLSPTGGDAIAVNGAVTLDGATSLTSIFDAGVYSTDVPQFFDVLTATGGITGEILETNFTPVNTPAGFTLGDNLVVLSFSDAVRVGLLSDPLTDFAMTPNQNAIAENFETNIRNTGSNDILTLYTEIAAQAAISPAAGAAALDQVSPEIYDAYGPMIVRTNERVSDLAFAELRKSRNEFDAYESEAGFVWARTWGGITSLEPSGDNFALDHGNAGLAVGLDSGGEKNRYGLMIAGFQDTVEADNVNHEGSSLGGILGLYGSFFNDGGHYLDMSVSVGVTQHETDRKIAFGAINETATSDHSSKSVALHAKMGQDLFKLGEFDVEGNVQLNLANVIQEEISETSTGSAALTIDEQNYTSARGIIGLDAGGDIYLAKNSTLRAEFGTGWLYDAAIGDHEVTGRFDTGENFTVKGIDESHSAIVSNAALRLTNFVTDSDLYVRYDGKVGDIETGSHSLTLGYKKLF